MNGTGSFADLNQQITLYMNRDVRLILTAEVAKINQWLNAPQGRFVLQTERLGKFVIDIFQSF